MTIPTGYSTDPALVWDVTEKSVTQEEARDKRPPLAVPWIAENFIDPFTKRPMELEPWQRRLLRRALEVDEEGRSRYNLVVWSQTKKSGKTTIAGAVGAWVANCVEAPNEISCVANDQEQSAGRIFAQMIPTLESLHWRVPTVMTGQPVAIGPTGSFVKAITTNYGKEAGANQGLSLWSELWAYKGERLTRLWEEMTPPPTRKFAMRWVETYAGFIGESVLLQSIYLKIFKDFQETETNPSVVKIFRDMPVYEIDDGRTLVFWDHDHRMPWQTEEYYRSQRDTMRLSSYLRLHENRWADSDESFISEAMWRNSERSEQRQLKATYALDASKDDATTALVGCIREGTQVRTTDVHIWEPKDGQDVNLRDVERQIVELHNKGLMDPPLWYDPYQCVKLAQDLRAKGIRCQEFPQGAMRVKADTFLYKLYKSGNMINYPHPGLRQHVLAASADIQKDNKLRIFKPELKAGDEEEPVRITQPSAGVALVRHVDAAVAQSMAAFKAYHRTLGGWGASARDMTE